ncbi:cytochrome P450 [Actinosynnema sp. NPDC004786]
MRLADKRRFRRDPLAYLEDLHRHSVDGVIRLPWGGRCVGDVELANALLRGREFNAGRSGFFGGLLPTREAQVRVGHAVRDVVRAGLPAYREALAVAVDGLPGTSRWPDAAGDLVYRCLVDVLLHPRTPEDVRGLLDRAARGDVVFHSPHRWRRVGAEVVRARLVAAVAGEVRRRRGWDGGARDVLDAVAGACPGGVADRAVAELHLMLVRAVVVPVATMLAWSVLLACLRHPPGTPLPWPVDWVVREAQRHRPVVWMVGRAAPHPTEFAGAPCDAGELISVSPYLLHHDPDRWDDPDEFRPERWAEPGRRGTYIPFGAGPFTCAGASVAHELLTEALGALTRDATLAVIGGDLRPAMVEGAVPRPFTLHRTPVRQAARTEGG